MKAVGGAKAKDDQRLGDTTRICDVVYRKVKVDTASNERSCSIPSNFMFRDDVWLRSREIRVIKYMCHTSCVCEYGR